MEAEQKSLGENIAEQKRRFLLNQQIANDPSRDEATRKLAAQYAQDTINVAKAEQEKVNTYKKTGQAFDELTGAVEKKKKESGESQFQFAMKQIELESKARETATIKAEADLQQKALDQYKAGLRKTGDLTKQEEKTIAERRLADRLANQKDIINKVAQLDAEGNVTGLSVGSKKGDAEKDLAAVKEKLASIGLAVSKDELNIIKMIPTITDDDRIKFENQLAHEIGLVNKQKIELGILPKEAAVDVLDGEIKRLQEQMARTHLQLIKDQSGNIIGVTEQDIQKLTIEAQKDLATLLGLQAERNKTIKDQNKELEDAQIAVIRNDLDRETAALKQKQTQELEFLTLRKASGVALTQQELDLEKAIELKHQRELLDLRKKFYNEDFDLQASLTRKLSDVILTAFKSEQSEKKRLSSAEIADKQLTFDKELQALRVSLSKGEIGQKEYNIKLAKLSEDRANFEKEQNASAQSAIVGQTKTALNSITGATFKYFDDIFQKYVVDAVLHDQLENLKTQQVVAGSIARGEAATSEVGPQQAANSAVGLGAVLGVVKSAIASLPFPVNIAASIAAGIAMSKAVQGLASLIKFETGGLGLVGEKGPEIIGPTKDFSQFVSQLVTQTVKTTQNSLDGISGSGSARRKGSLRHKFEFEPLRASGRDMVTSQARETIASRTELLVS
jgi:hypothetical protein